LSGWETGGSGCEQDFLWFSVWFAHHTAAGSFTHDGPGLLPGIMSTQALQQCKRLICRQLELRSPFFAYQEPLLFSSV
jgi:hypothetical protein